MTLSCLLSVLGKDKADSKGCGAVFLDLDLVMLYSGIMYQNKNNTSRECRDEVSRHCHIYLFGDAKTIENENKWICDLQGRRLSYDEINVQGGKFLEATKCVMALPGDWHASMPMLQSIFTLYYYYGFLEPIQQLLGWKCIQVNVRGCYFQASCFVVFVADEFIRYFLEDYICNVHNFSATRIPSNQCCSHSKGMRKRIVVRLSLFNLIFCASRVAS